MRDGNLSQAFKDMLRKEHSPERAYTQYAALVDEKMNRNKPVHATHVATWTNKHGLSGEIDRLSRLLTAGLPRARSSRSKPFSFKSYHVLDENTLEEIEAAIDRGVAMENISSFLAGIFTWLFFLSIPLVPVVGYTFLLLTGISFLGFWGSIFSLSNARLRYLPSEFRDISADYWAVQTLAGIATLAPGRRPEGG